MQLGFVRVRISYISPWRARARVNFYANTNFTKKLCPVFNAARLRKGGQEDDL